VPSACQPETVFEKSKMRVIRRFARIQAGFRAKDNDADDWASVPIAAYADLMLTERHLRGFIRQADRQVASRVTADPGEAVDILRKWT
jgi:hypothetical protein